MASRGHLMVKLCSEKRETETTIAEYKEIRDITNTPKQTCTSSSSPIKDGVFLVPNFDPKYVLRKRLDSNSILTTSLGRKSSVESCSSSDENRLPISSNEENMPKGHCVLSICSAENAVPDEIRPILIISTDKKSDGNILPQIFPIEKEKLDTDDSSNRPNGEEIDGNCQEISISEGNNPSLISNENQNMTLPISLTDSLLNTSVLFSEENSCTNLFSLLTKPASAMNQQQEVTDLVEFFTPSSNIFNDNVVIEFVDEGLHTFPINPNQSDVSRITPISHSTPKQSSCLDNYTEDTNKKNAVDQGEGGSTSTTQVTVYSEFPIAAPVASCSRSDVCSSSVIDITDGNKTMKSSINIEDNDSFPTKSSSDQSSSQNIKCAFQEGRKKQGRKRKFPDQNRNIKKSRLNNNQEYINNKGVIVRPKEFVGENFNCNCHNKCSDKVSVEIRRAEFEKFWNSGSYETRCSLLQGYVKEYKKIRCYGSENSKRKFSRRYIIGDVPVCKKLFLNTFGISQSRIDVALTKYRKHEIKDCRGTAGGSNKLPDNKVSDILIFMKKFPKYKSHYCRSKSETRYLAPNLNLQKVYDLYKESHENYVSLATFKKIFYEKFDLRFKKPHKDTCLRCDVFNTNKQVANSTKLQEIELEHADHLEHANSLRTQMKYDLELSRKDPLVETLTVDLQKTHNLPCVPTGIAYYKRQLNLYNLGIHCGSTNKGIFHVWLEHEGGRGTQEVGSCLRKFVLEDLKPTADHLIIWADACGGQNRSIKMIVMLLHLLQNHDRLKVITIRYLQPGHTFLPNDSEFGDVECALKYNTRLYTDWDYITVMANCRRKNKFIVKRMKPEDFVSAEPILKAITNRKFDIEKTKISWLNTFEIEIKIETPNLIYMKSALQSSPKIVDISKKTKRKHSDNIKDIKLLPLWPDGKALSTAKIKDLQDLIKLVPPDCKNFYNFLKHVPTNDFTDDVDGFGTSLDFEIQDDEN